MMQYDAGDLVICRNCGEPLFTLTRPIDTKEVPQHSMVKAIPPTKQPVLHDRIESCHKCGSIGWNFKRKDTPTP